MSHNKCAQMRRGQPNHLACDGFALLIVIVLLALLSVGLARATRTCLGAVVSADAREAELRTRWLVRSADDLLLEAEALIAFQDESYRSGQVQFVWDASTTRIDLTIADEHAKADLNELWSRLDPDQFRENLRDFAGRTRITADSTLRIEPRPLTEFHLRAAGLNTESKHWPTFGSLHQVFETEDPATIAKLWWMGDGQTPPWSELFTLSGGRTRLDRASVQALELTLGDILDHRHIDALLTERASDTAPTDATALVDRMQLNAAQRRSIRNRVSDRSHQYSVTLTIDDGRRTYCRTRYSNGKLLMGAFPSEVHHAN